MDAEGPFSCIGIDIGMAFVGKDGAHQKGVSATMKKHEDDESEADDFGRQLIFLCLKAVKSCR